MSHHDHPMYAHNAGSVARMEPLPLPPPEGMTAKLKKIHYTNRNPT